MGTVVLPPQDCLSSHLQRYNPPPLVRVSSPLPTPPRSKRKAALQSSIMRAPDYSSAKPAANVAHTGSISSGLLPTPGQSRTSTAHVPLPFNSPLGPHTRPRLMSSVITPPRDVNSELSALPVHSMRDGLSSAYHAKSHVFPSRSSSASGGPIVCFSHSNNSSLSMERPYASTGRHPFRLVQGNEMTSQSAPNTGSNINVLQENVQYSKFSDTKVFRKGVVSYDKKLGVREKLNESDFLGDIVKRSQGDFLPIELSKEDEDVYLKPPKKETDGNKDGKRQLVDQVSSTRQIAGGAGFKQKIAFGPSATVTILQRPKSKEAARELLQKFEWKGQASVCPLTQTGRISRSCSDVGVSLQNVIPEGQSIPSSATTLAFGQSLPSSATTLAANAYSFEKEVYGYRRKQAARCEVLERRKMDSGASACKKEGVTEDATDVLFPMLPMTLDERWAGPAYSISPPPSSLPLPKFSLRQLRSCSLELQFMDNKGTSDRTRTAVTPIISPEQSVIPPGWPTHDVRIDVVNATRDLRRILNLDSC